MDYSLKRDALKKSEIFNGLTKEQLDVLVPLLKEVDLSPGELFLKEGEVGEPFYIILEGEVDILKKDPISGQDIHLRTFQQGDIFGEIAPALDHRRTASVKALKQTSLLEISLEKLSHTPQAKELNTHIRLQLSNVLAGKIKEDNMLVLESLQRTLEHEKKQSNLGRFLIYLMLLIFAYIYSLRISSILNIKTISSTIISLPVLTLFAVVMFVYMKKSGYPWREYGLTWKNWKQSLFSSILWTLPFLGVMAFVKWLIIQINPVFRNQTVFSFSPALSPGATETSDVLLSVLLIGAYLIFVPVQEIIYRGTMQTVLEKLLVGRHRIMASILISNLPFSLIHLHLSFYLTIIVYFIGAFWGGCSLDKELSLDA